MTVVAHSPKPAATIIQPRREDKSWKTRIGSGRQPTNRSSETVGWRSGIEVKENVKKTEDGYDDIDDFFGAEKEQVHPNRLGSWNSPSKKPILNIARFLSPSPRKESPARVPSPAIPEKDSPAKLPSPEQKKSKTPVRFAEPIEESCAAEVEQTSFDDGAGVFDEVPVVDDEPPVVYDEPVVEEVAPPATKEEEAPVEKKEKKPRKKAEKRKRAPREPSPARKKIEMERSNSRRKSMHYKLPNVDDEDEEADTRGLRRSKRVRIPPLEFWRNERIAYTRTKGSAVPVVHEYIRYD